MTKKMDGEIGLGKPFKQKKHFLCM